jgi:hypothetical protein
MIISRCRFAVEQRRRSKAGDERQLGSRAVLRAGYQALICTTRLRAENQRRENAPNPEVSQPVYGLLYDRSARFRK